MFGGRHPALILVDPEFEGTLKKALNALHHPASRSSTFDQNDEVIGIAGKVVSATFKLFIQIVQDDIGQQGRKWTTLRNPDSGFLQLTINQNPGAKVSSDEAQDSLVANLSGHAVHQNVMVYSIEELGQVQVYSNAEAFSDGFPNSVHRIMGRAPGAKTEARIRKARIEDRRQHLGYGLAQLPYIKFK